MRRKKRIITAAFFTLLLVLGAFGFWLADYQSGKIAFNKQNRRVDVIVNDSTCEIVLRENSFSLTLPDRLFQAIENTKRFLPPDMQGALLLLENVYNK